MGINVFFTHLSLLTRVTISTYLHSTKWTRILSTLVELFNPQQTIVSKRVQLFSPIYCDRGMSAYCQLKLYCHKIWTVFDIGNLKFVSALYRPLTADVKLVIMARAAVLMIQTWIVSLPRY